MDRSHSHRQMPQFRSDLQTAQQGKAHQDEQDQPKRATSPAENGIPALEAVATAQERQDQDHNKDKYDWTHD